MCGICGVIGAESAERSEAVVHRMMAAMVHRGPDEEGLLSAPPVAVGMRRLSILDLSGGSQPIWNETGTLAVVFNGEIYNFRELHRELEAAGHTFSTYSDTEVIVHAYEAWGERCVQRLRGMFALALVEMPHGPSGGASRVFLARDRLGIKPLYYASVDGSLVFASEVRALLASGCIPTQLSSAAVMSYLLFGSVCEPLTLIDGIIALPPGHSVTISARVPVGSLRAIPYWTVDNSVSFDVDGSKASMDEAPAERVRSLLEDAVSTHLVADVPVGVFLSSGLDSTAIAALASRARSGIHTFTVAFPDVEFSEAEIARRTASRLKTDHRELTISNREMTRRLDEAIAAFDQPSMDGVNTYFVSWAARQAGLKVALSGLGSDEIFGGYPSFRTAPRIEPLAKFARAVPHWLRQLSGDSCARIADYLPSADSFRKACAAWTHPDSLPAPYFFTRLLFSPKAVARGMSSDSHGWHLLPWWERLNAAAQEARALDHFAATSWLELRSYMLNTLLRDTDVMSMTHSLEVRVPFLDSSLVEYVLSLPASQKRGPSGAKSLLVEAIGELIPAEIVGQRKRTFTFPWERWLRSELGERVSAGLAEWSPALESILDRRFALAVWNDYRRGRTSWSRPWSLYVLNEWVKRNLETTRLLGAELRNPAEVSAG